MKCAVRVTAVVWPVSVINVAASDFSSKPTLVATSKLCVVTMDKQELLAYDYVWTCTAV